ncbi:MAG: hypothetical protein KKI07_03985, partial [Euryarchaeota archaeon]|nr:hypothetical protein [Euryarchaeota archaeon]
TLPSGVGVSSDISSEDAVADKTDELKRSKTDKSKAISFALPIPLPPFGSHASACAAFHHPLLFQQTHIRPQTIKGFGYLKVF